MTRAARLAAWIGSVFVAAATVGVAGAQDPQQADPGLAPLAVRDLDASRLERHRRVRIDEALRTGAYERAQTLLLEEVERSPGSPELLRVLGGVFFLRSMYLNSAVALKKAEALAPLDDRSRFTLAMAYVAMGRRRWARPELLRLAQANATTPLYRYWIARLDYDEELFAAASDGFLRVLAVDPRYIKAHDNLGLAQEALGRYDEAIESYREAIRLNRERGTRNSWPALNLGILLMRLDDFDEAEQLFREAARGDPGLAQARYQLGLLHEKQGLPADAIAELHRAAQLDAAYAEPHYALSRLYRRTGEVDKAGHALERFLALKKQKAEGGAGAR